MYMWTTLKNVKPTEVFKCFLLNNQQDLLTTSFHTKIQKYSVQIKYTAKVNKESPSFLDKNITNSHFWIKLWIKLWQNWKNNDPNSSIFTVVFSSMLGFKPGRSDDVLNIIFETFWFASLWKSLYDWFRVDMYVWLKCRLQL